MPIITDGQKTLVTGVDYALKLPWISPLEEELISILRADHIEKRLSKLLAPAGAADPKADTTSEVTSFSTTPPSLPVIRSSDEVPIFRVIASQVSAGPVHEVTRKNQATWTPEEKKKWTPERLERWTKENKAGWSFELFPACSRFHIRIWENNFHVEATLQPAEKEGLPPEIHYENMEVPPGPGVHLVGKQVGSKSTTAGNLWGQSVETVYERFKAAESGKTCGMLTGGFLRSHDGRMQDRFQNFVLKRMWIKSGSREGVKNLQLVEVVPQNMSPTVYSTAFFPRDPKTLELTGPPRMRWCIRGDIVDFQIEVEAKR